MRTQTNVAAGRLAGSAAKPLADEGDRRPGPLRSEAVTAIELPLARVLIIAPHPDDDVIATAGLMQKTRAAGGRIRVLFVTDGENNGWPQRFMELKIFLGSTDRWRWGVLRRREAEDSLIRLGIPRS